MLALLLVLFAPLVLLLQRLNLLPGILAREDVTLTDLEPAAITTDVNAVLAKYVQERDTAYGFFVERETDQWKQKYQLGGVDEGQETGADGRPLETRVAGEYEIALPWKRIKWALGWNYEMYARMTVADLNRNLVAKTAGNAKRHMREIFRALFGAANYSTEDEDKHGTLLIRRLANGDGTLYAPTVDSDAEAEANHYVVAEYTAATISATNNPLAIVKEKLRGHFPTAQAIVVLINSAQRKQILTGLGDNFTDAGTSGITPGADTATATALADANIPGEFLGIDGDTGVYVYVYDRVPANYCYGGAVGAPGPLLRRVPEVATLRGFVVEAEEAHNPFYKRSWVERFGYGAGNRLNGVVVQLKAGGAYETPAAYA